MARAQVIYKEQILNSYSNAGSTLYSAIVIPATRGKINTPLIPGGPTQFIKQCTPFNTIDVGMNLAYFSALKIYEATNNLIIIRAAHDDCLVAGATFSPPGDENKSLTTGLKDSDSYKFNNESFALLSADPGAWGNNLSVAIYNYKFAETLTSAGSVLPSTQKWGNGFPVKVSGVVPTQLSIGTTYYITNTSKGVQLTSSFASATSASPVTLTFDDTTGIIITPAVQYTKIPNTFAILVFNGTDLTNPVIDPIIASKDPTAKNGSNSLYIGTVLEDNHWIKVQDNSFVSDTYVQDQIIPLPLAGGSDGSPVTTGDMINALSCIPDNTQYNIKLIADGGWTDPAYQQALITQCESIKGRFPILSAPINLQSDPATAAQAIVDWRNNVAGFDSSFGGLYASHQKIYDQFNDRYIWVSPDGFATRNLIQTAGNYALWYPMSGTDTGVINSLDCKVRFTDADQDLLYDNGINPIIFDNEDGICIWGQKTLKKQPSLDSYINVRLMLITIGPEISKILKSELFRYNDDDSRSRALALVKTYMDTVKSQNGVRSYTMTCDSTNNTAADLNANRMKFYLGVCPMGDIEEIDFAVGVVDNTATMTTTN